MGAEALVSIDVCVSASCLCLFVRVTPDQGRFCGGRLNASQGSLERIVVPLFLKCEYEMKSN